MTYNVLLAECACKIGTYFDPSTTNCLPCGQNCASCDPNDPNICFTCLGSIPLIGTQCGCAPNTYLKNLSCVNCPS